MKTIKVMIIHPIDRSSVEVDIDPTLTSKEVIKLLLDESFMTPLPGGFTLALKGGSIIEESSTLAAAGVKEGSALTVTPATDAGIICSRKEGGNGR